MGQQAEAPEGRLALEPAGQVVGQGARLERRAEHELTGVQDERLAGRRFDEAGQLVLLLGRVDVGVAGVVEDPEQGVEADVDARRLHQAVFERIDAQPSGIDLGSDITVGEQHPTRLSAPGDNLRDHQRQLARPM
jgi:hypothetical protein